MKIWEYKTVKAQTLTNNIGESELNDLGRAGWELVTVHSIEKATYLKTTVCEGGYIYFFKRELND